jgi:DNA-binding NarL/FixJ family response regulator
VNLSGNSDKKIRVVVVDDHPIVRQGIKALLADEPDIRVCGEAASAHEALEVIGRTRPHVAVVDLALKESSGLDLIKDLQVRHPDVLALVLSMRDESFYAQRVLAAGAKGYIAKEEGTEKVIEGIRRILAGEIYVSEKLASRMIRKLVGHGPEPGESPVQKLTDRELQVFELIGAGLPTREIARRLSISAKTVESHREHIKDKLKLGSSTELLKHAIQWGQGEKNT